jgi:hypothetical protein
VDFWYRRSDRTLAGYEGVNPNVSIGLTQGRLIPGGRVWQYGTKVNGQLCELLLPLPSHCSRFASCRPVEHCRVSSLPAVDSSRSRGAAGASDAASWHNPRVDSLQANTNIETARRFKRFTFERFSHLAVKSFRIPSPFCDFSLGREQILVRFAGEQLSCTHSITALA